MTITAYRITKSKYANVIWSGIGARDYGGRWNSKGVPVVYAAENRSLAAIEQLAQLIPPRVLRGFVIASIIFDSNKMIRIDVNSLPAGWDDPFAPASLKKYGDDFLLAATRFPVLSVPSAVVKGEWNFLMNPAHPAFAGFVKSIPEPFVYDVRLR